MTSELNDLSRPTRRMVFVQAGGGALMLGSVMLVDDSLLAFLGCLAVGAGAMLGTPIWLMVWSRRRNGRFLDRTEAGSAEIVSGRVVPLRASGRTVRSRVEVGRTAYVDSGALPPHHPSRALVATVLTPDGPRRAMALVPAELHLTAGGTPIAVLLHPHDHDVAVLDTATDAAALAAGDTDPRWTTCRIPSDRTVVGGWSLAALSAALGVVAALGGVLLLERVLG